MSWRNSTDYYGWAPLSPGASLTAYNNTPSYWTFVRHRDFGRTNITNYYINSTSNTNILRNTTIINRIRRDESSNMIYTIGPDRTEVQKRTGKSFASVKIKDRNAPGQKSSSRELHLYRPQIKSSASGKQPRPKNITDRKDVKPQPKVQPSAIPQRDRKETAPKVAPPKNSRPDREMERPREVAPKIREPKIDRPAKEVERPRQTIPSPQPPRINPPVSNPSPPVRMQEPPMNRPSNPSQRPNIDRPVPQGKRDGGPGGKIKL